MELLGKIGERQIFYCNIRADKDWFEKISFNNWVAFTIADEEDKELLHDMASHCLDRGACYTCSAGQLASLTEDYFLDEIVWREIQKQDETGKTPDYESTPMTSFHRDFSEGFWFAATNANSIIYDAYVTSNQVICIDCTTKKVRQYLIYLIGKINDGWLPDEDELEKPFYDDL